MSAPAPITLQRETFELSRALEFFSEKELTAQIGFSRPDWPVALFKELLDNALDAAESANIAPVIHAEMGNDALVVSDNGPGLPLAVLKKSLDYAVRVSDKTGYVSPSRGQQGNALKVKPMTVKDAAYQVMEQAYMKASSDGSLPANARQIMYAARPLIIELTGKASPWKNSSTFTQTLLNDFIAEHPDLCANWDVVFDDRGHFEEPHTGNKIGIGTLAVRGYIREWESKVVIEDLEDPDQLSIELPTSGPALRYRFALFIEKEGFTPLLQRAQIAKRYDLAIMSTKGMSTTAARQLVERLSDSGVTVLVVRDFDKAGFSIVHTLRTDTRRYQFKTPPNVIDMGLRLQDAEDMELDSEAVSYSDNADPRPGLAERGAIPDELKFLVSGKSNGQWIGSRVELNAMDSATFIQWLEEKLKAHGVKKHIPAEADLRQAWQRAWRINELNKAITKTAADIDDAPEPPDDLVELVTARLTKSPTMAWDMALIEEEEEADSHE